jgi:hypothetical protein
MIGLTTWPALAFAAASGSARIPVPVSGKSGISNS